MHHMVEYHRSSAMSDGALTNHSLHHASENTLLNITNDCFYSSDYWNIPYTNGLTPMKQIEGNVEFGSRRFFNNVIEGLSTKNTYFHKVL